MSNKEEKIHRMMELSHPMSYIIAKSWVEQAEQMGDGFLGHYSHLSISSKDYYRCVVNA